MDHNDRVPATTVPGEDERPREQETRFQICSLKPLLELARRPPFLRESVYLYHEGTRISPERQTEMFRDASRSTSDIYFDMLYNIPAPVTSVHGPRATEIDRLAALIRHNFTN